MMRLIFFAFVLAVGACDQSPAPATSFYYWKTVFKLTDHERHVLAENNVRHLYIRYMDVVLKDTTVVPASPIIFADKPDGFKIIPVIYIKNQVMLKPSVEVDVLAEKIISFVYQVNKKNGFEVDELQIDCDWSEESKSKYFKLLRAIGARSTLRISATIRLHQVKYRERTGVPPVSKGVLMYYNMGRIAADDSNSIYERSTAIRYLDRLHNYPLALDVALPVFAWGVHIRGNRVVALLRDVDEQSFRADSDFMKINDALFESKNGNFKAGHRFERADQIKIESIGREQLEEMTVDLKRKLKHTPGSVIFYDLDEINLKPFDHESDIFQKICTDF